MTSPTLQRGLGGAAVVAAIVLACPSHKSGMSADDGDPRSSSRCTTARTDELLVSGYWSNNVHRFNFCGVELGTLDDRRRITGAQATAIGPDGLLYVASEDNGRILRYRIDTLEFVDTWFDVREEPEALGGARRPLALTFGDDGDAYIGGFNSGIVVRVGADRIIKRVYDVKAAGLQGLDAGITFHPDGRLLVPGYDSNTVHAIDVDTADISLFAFSGLSNPRVIAVDEAHRRILVSNEGSGLIVAFDYEGRRMDSDVPWNDVTGMAIDTNGDIFVTDANRDDIGRFASDGTFRGAISRSSDLRAAVFITIVPRGT